MAAPMMLARCGPEDFINPYPALFWSATVCAVLLSLEVFVFFLTTRRFYPARQALWLSRMRQVLNRLTFCTALLALVLAALLGWQSLHFVSTCTIAGFAQVLIYPSCLVAVGMIIGLTALFFVGGLVLLASQFWLASRTVRSAR